MLPAPTSPCWPIAASTICSATPGRISRRSIEAYAEAAQTGTPVPRPMLATHENLAVSMAHGYAMVSRRMPAVMVHVSVGTANMICAALNAARENVAILLTAGRSPLTETGLPGSRDGYIHWAQEMYDQAGMIREIVKWDYELRNGEQLDDGDRPRAGDCRDASRAARSTCRCRARCIAAPASDLAPLSPCRLNAAAPPAADGAAIAAAAAPAGAGETASHRDVERRARPRQRLPHSGNSPSASPSRWCSTGRATCRCRPRIR